MHCTALTSPAGYSTREQVVEFYSLTVPRVQQTCQTYHFEPPILVARPELASCYHYNEIAHSTLKVIEANFRPILFT